MLLKIFGNTKPNNFILTYLLSALCIIISKIWILESHFSLWELLQTIGVIFLIWGNLFFVDLIHHSLYASQKNRFVLFFFFSISNFFPYIYGSFEIIITNFFILWIIFQLLKIKNSTYEKKLLFDTSLLLFGAGMCYSWAFLFVIPLWIVIFLYTTTPFRNFFIPIVVFFGFSFLIISILLPSESYHYFISVFKLDIKLDTEKYLQLDYLLPIAFLLLMSLIFLVISLRKHKKNNNSNHFILIISTLTLLCILTLSEYPKNADILFLILPISLFFGNQIVKIEKTWIKKAILWIFLLFPLMLQIFYRAC